MYKIRGADQKEYGPVNADAVRQWIAQRRANAQTLVQIEGDAEWKPLGELPEFKDALAQGPQPPGLPQGSTRPPAMPGAVSTKSAGLAIASFVLGVFSLGCMFFTGLPAIIMGHVAHGRARRQPERYGGAGFAIAGYVLGYISLFLSLAVGAALLLPALAKIRSQGRSYHAVQCESNLKQLGLAARLYSNDHGDVFPTDFMQMTNELGNPIYFICPAAWPRERPMPQTWAEFNRADITYEFVSPGLKEVEAAREVIFRCPIHQSVCYGDGSVREGRGRGRR